MNNHTPSDPHDDDKISSLYKQGSIETPARYINEKIRQRARQGSASVIQFPLRRVFNVITSSRSLKVAAVLVIGVSIILQIQFDHPEQMSIPMNEEYSDNGMFADKPVSDSSDFIQEESFAPSISSDSMKESLVEQTLSTSLEPRTPKPAKKAKPAPAKPGPGYEMQRREKSRSMELEKRRLHEKIIEEKQASSKRKQTEMNLQSLATSPQVLISEAGAEDICRTLNSAACLASSSCVLSNTNNELTCHAAMNHCERDFRQLDDQSDLCQQREQCEYTAGKCDCDTDGSCECINKTPPSCKLIIEEDK